MNGRFLTVGSVVLALSPSAWGAEPLRIGGLRLTLGGEVSGSFAPFDEGFFNDTGYDVNPTRRLGISVLAELRAGSHFAVLSELRSENAEWPHAHALYLRFRPWLDREFDVQAGLVPPAFGTQGRRYGLANLLIGEPLAYQYLTTLRHDAIPYTPDDLLSQAGSGWFAEYPGGVPAAVGLPLIGDAHWDTGIQARWSSERLSAVASLTQGSASNPVLRDDNRGKQASAGVTWRPVVGLVLGLSGTRGDYFSDWAYGRQTGVPPGCCTQSAWAADAEYSAGYGLVRAEVVWSAWETPAWSPRLRASALSLEGRYKLMPGLYVAARAGRLGFSEVQGTATRGPWDAPVTRLEVGLGYSLRRNLLLKVAFQHNAREAGHVRRKNLVAGQALWWF